MYKRLELELLFVPELEDALLQEEKIWWTTLCIQLLETTPCHSIPGKKTVLL
jgi:hypothetical protein